MNGRPAPVTFRPAAPRRTLKWLRVLVMVLLGCALGVNGNVATSSAATPHRAQPLTSIRKVSLGISMLPPNDLSVLDAFTDQMGGHARRPAIWSVWSSWFGPSAAFPRTLMDGLAARRVVPMVFWQPDDPRRKHVAVVTYQQIVDGKFDPYIRRWAHDAASYGRPIILRFAHEMDGNWFPWSIGQFGNTGRNFIAAWRHVWTIFKGPGGEGAENVRFLWSPWKPGKSMGSGATRIYPGDTYVDYVGFSAFNPAVKEHPWRAMGKIYRDLVASLDTFTQKPIVVAETGSRSKVRHGRNLKPRWIERGYETVYDAYPRVTAIVYFNVEDGARDWRLTVPRKAFDAYRSLLAQRRFRGHLSWAAATP